MTTAQFRWIRDRYASGKPRACCVRRVGPLGIHLKHDAIQNDKSYEESEQRRTTPRRLADRLPGSNLARFANAYT